MKIAGMGKITFVLFSVLILFCTSQCQQDQRLIDRDSKVKGFFESGWFLENIPFIDLPDDEIEEIYYYRWATHKRHLRYNGPGSGYTVTEFVHPVSYSGKFDTISDAAGHHIYESRWLKDNRYNQVSNP